MTPASFPGWRAAGSSCSAAAAELAGERSVTVGPETLSARRAVVMATGTAAAVPPIEGLAEAAPWTNREATTAGEVPAAC